MKISKFMGFYKFLNFINNLSFLIKYSIENNLSYKLLPKLKDIDIPADLLSI